jgi:hypothetical protein
MCYNCGCMLPDDSMGHDDNIVNQTFERLAEEKGKSADEIKRWVLEMLEKGEITDPDIIAMFDKASKAWGQPVQEAERYTKELLKDTLKD